MVNVNRSHILSALIFKVARVEHVEYSSQNIFNFRQFILAYTSKIMDLKIKFGCKTTLFQIAKSGSTICSLCNEQDLLTSTSAVELVTPTYPPPHTYVRAAEVGKSCPLCEVSILCPLFAGNAYAFDNLTFGAQFSRLFIIKKF
jgi:hypothetical protein